MTASMYTVPYISTPDPTNPNLRFLEEVSLRTAGVSRLEMCIQCGTCGGSCPSAEDMDHTPRMLFAMIRAGYREAGAEEQHAVDLCLVLSLRGALSARCAHRRCDVHPQEHGDSSQAL